ncbi:MAG: ATP-binding cassette domain-containing protein, partial [Anaerolineae bacterium]|nr:ATP-binding cassette domain-containing protein [Anaerolineae bacterium]
YETDVLFNLIERLKARGITIIYISHRLEEVFRIADRITVLRDGHYIQTWDKAETNTSEIVAAMVGRKSDEMFARESSVRPQIVLEVEQLSVKGKLEPVSLCVQSGEVVGFVGLADAGVSVLFEALFGVQRTSGGRISLNGQPAQVFDPRAAMQHNVGMVPADRRGLGLMMNWSVLDNLTLSILTRLSHLGIIDQRKTQQTAADYVERLNIITDNLNKGVVYLSGGNQQKTLLARWLATQPQLLILEDPTRGIDVGAKHEIYQIVDQIAAEGVGVLFTSSEIEEVLALCDRILIFRNHRLIADIPRHAADKSLVMEFSAGDVSTAQNSLRSRLTAQANATILPEYAGADTHHEQEAPAEPRRQGSSPWLRLMSIREIGVAQALIAVVVLFSLLTPFFFTASNLLLISRQMAILGVIAVGMTFVLASGEVDLSVGWNFNMVMSAMAVLMVNGVDPWLTIPIGLALGALLGVFNGVFAVVFQLPTIIVTLGTLTLYRGLALSLSGGRTVGNLPDSSFFQIGSGNIGGVP